MVVFDVGGELTSGNGGGTDGGVAVGGELTG